MVTRREATAGILLTAVLAGRPGLAAQEAMTVKLPPPRGPNFVHYNKVRVFQRFFVACNFLHATRMQHGCDESLILFSPRCHPI